MAAFMLLKCEKKRKSHNVIYFYFFYFFRAAELLDTLACIETVGKLIIYFHISSSYMCLQDSDAKKQKILFFCNDMTFFSHLDISCQLQCNDCFYQKRDTLYMMNFHNVFRGTFTLYVALERVWGNGVLGKWTALTEALIHTLVHHWAAAAMQVAAKPIGSNSVSQVPKDTYRMWTVRAKTPTTDPSIAGRTASTEQQIR